MKEQIAIDLRPWGDEDLPLMHRLLGDPAMTVYLGGPESPEKLRARHQRFVRSGREPGPEGLFVILAGPDNTPAGSMGYWEREWQDRQAWEAGWSVLLEFQGRGIATRALLLAVEHARARHLHRFMHAFPSVDNAASNAVCRKAAFKFMAAVDFEYPRGHNMRCNDWRLDLSEVGRGE